MSKTVEYYNRNAAGYDSSHGRMAPLVHQKYRDAIGATPIPLGNLLDIGIGTGLSSMRYSSTHTIFGVDGAQNMLNRCAKMGRASNDNLKCVDLNKGTLPFNDNSFAFTISNACLVYLADSCQIIQEMVRVTQPGGILAFDLLVHEEDTRETLSYVSKHAQQRAFITADNRLVEAYAGTDVISEQVLGEPTQFEDPAFGRAHYQTALSVLRKT